MAGAVRWHEIVTAAVAAYGAALSTYQYIVGRRERRRQIKVTLSWGLAPPALPGGEPWMLIAMEAANSGSRPVMLDAPAILLPSGKQVVFPVPQSSVSFPHHLTEGSKCSVWVNGADLADALVREHLSGEVDLVARFRDALGAEYRSKPLRVDSKVLLQERSRR